jgi:hypothetical protein
VSPSRRSFSNFFSLTGLRRLSQSRREELSLIGTQFWFFGLAVFAVGVRVVSRIAFVDLFIQLVFESIPHMYVWFL